METLYVHSGYNFSDEFGSSALSINPSTTFKLKDIYDWGDYFYARYDNPTRKFLEKALSEIEFGKFAIAFSSGMSAIHALMSLLEPGDEIIVEEDHYGGTFYLSREVFLRYGLKVRTVDLREPENFRRSIGSRTKIVFFETPTNPMMRIVDIEAISSIAREKGILTIVDNTFASPYLQNPLKLGADAVIHSLTKYISGHSDVLGGAFITNSEEIYEKVKRYQKITGAVLSPLESFLALRGIRTLHVRMQRHCENAKRIVEFLKEHPKVSRIYYPGLDPKAKKQMRDFGGMVSFEVEGDPVKLVKSTRIFTLAVSLGSVESLITHPATTTHKELPDDIKRKVGVSDKLVRISVGLENVEDLIEDLKQALDRA